jgi:hypothetical protein
LSDRSIRRAAEREARKAARHAANLQAAADRQEASRNESVAVSEAQLAANRENAQKSTGPRTEEGKAKIRLNAVTTGLTPAKAKSEGVTIRKAAEEFIDYCRSARSQHPQQQGRSGTGRTKSSDCKREDR